MHHNSFQQFSSTMRRLRGALLCSLSRLSGATARRLPPSWIICKPLSINKRYRLTFPRIVENLKLPSSFMQERRALPSSFLNVDPSGCPLKRSFILSQGGLIQQIRGASSHGQLSCKVSPSSTILSTTSCISLGGIMWLSSPLNDSFRASNTNLFLQMSTATASISSN